MTLLDEPVRQGGLAMVNVGDDAKITGLCNRSLINFRHYRY
jgi:hypothetical protein